MTVQRVSTKSPRVTKPYTEEQWRAIDALGDAGRRASSQRGDVRLTMGGEPTFVSIDDIDGAEWNTAALGPHKRVLGGELLRRLKRAVSRRAAAALRPGQVVSRRVAAALGARLLLARDGEPIWDDDRADRRRADSDYGHGDGRAQRFVDALAGRLERRPGARDARPTKTSGTTCGRNGGCRSTSIRCNRSLTTTRSARGSRASSSRARARSSATRCRCPRRSTPKPGCTGKAATGSSAPSTCS